MARNIDTLKTSAVAQIYLGFRNSLGMDPEAAEEATRRHAAVADCQWDTSQIERGIRRARISERSGRPVCVTSSSDGQRGRGRRQLARKGRPVAS